MPGLLPEEEAGGTKGLGMTLSLGFLKLTLEVEARAGALFFWPECPALGCCDLASCTLGCCALV